MPINNSGFNTSQIQDLIRSKGEWVLWSKGMKCTCALQQTGTSYSDPNRANPNCQACHGLGWVWIPSGQIIGIVSDIKQEKELMMAGIATPGDLMFSPDLSVTLSDYDKIQLTWPEGLPFEGELIQKGVDKTTYGIISVPAGGCITIDINSGSITTYQSDIDFTFNGTAINWLNGHGPADGEIYSLKYNALIDWIVFAPPQPRRERGTNLGQRVILRKKHLVAFGT